MSVVYVSGEKTTFSVGRDPGVDLVLDGTFVSRHHMLFRTVRDDVAAVEVSGTNGAVVKGIQVHKGYKGYIRAGDCISIGDIRLVWTGRRRMPAAPAAFAPAGRDLPDAAPVEIEGPPQRHVPQKPSIMLAAGPALTMAIPILLGAGRRIAVLSSVFAAVWAVANVLGRVRRQRTDENRRRNTYLAYISECEELIKSRLKETINALNDLYPPVYAYLRPDRSPFLLWRGVPGDHYNLLVRTGVGTIDSPLEIVIPRERFAGIDDSLRDFPGMIKNRYRTIPACPVLVDLVKGSVTGFCVKSERSRQALAAVILHLSVSYSPDTLSIFWEAGRDVADYYNWLPVLPHYWREGRETEYKVFITDEDAKAMDKASDGFIVILLTDRTVSDASCHMKIIDADGGGTAFDMIPPEFCYSYSAEMSARRGNVADEGIPETVPFGRLIDEMIPSLGGYAKGEEAVTHLARGILERYRRSDITESVRAAIGLKERGEKLYLDLHERFAGPHGLIAGTTGSGKSELLATIILSFAASYPPDKLAFFLIDYKGGGMSNMFEDLPHLVGNISNLTGSLTRRAMTALGSENTRRQEIFASCAVNNIGDYTRLYEEGKVSEPLPHILIIVDEFAELKREEPEFMDRLISISQVGRSLGMHLILATQKPAGVVDDKIRSNSGFRIALRLVDRADSMDMLQRPDAVSIKSSGRGYIQIAKDGSFECFQSGYAMAPVRPDGEAPRIYTDFYMREEVRAARDQDDDTVGPYEALTWYELVMKAVAAASLYYDKKGPPKLWLPPLPGTVEDDSAFAVFDDPGAQRYVRMPYDPDKAGHVLVSGRSGSGKSELLYTLINRLRSECAVYVIDYGGGRLAPVREYDHCGGYIGDDDRDNVTRLTGFIDGILSDRRKRSKADEPIEPILLVIDDLGEVRSAADMLFSEHLRRILTLGKSAGIFVCASILCPTGTKDEKLFDTCLFLGSVDPYVASSAMRVPIRDIPVVEDIPGRGIGLIGKDVLEFQAVMTGLGGDRSPPWKLSAAKYPYVPKNPTPDDFLARARSEIDPNKGSEGLLRFPVGYEQTSGRLYAILLKRIRCVLIGGKPYSGRHTLLFNISLTAAFYGIKCVKADTYETLVSNCRESTQFKIITINSMTDLLEEFYERARSPEEEEELCSYLVNQDKSRMTTKNSFLVFALIDNEARTRFYGTKIYDAMTRDPYGIVLGGCLDENRIFDFSYLPFSKQQASQKRGYATVVKSDEKSYFGTVILPGPVDVDNSQTLENRG